MKKSISGRSAAKAAFRNSGNWIELAKRNTTRRAGMLMHVLIAGAIVLALPTILHAQTRTWDGSDDMGWTQPDTTSWGGDTYSSGDPVQFFNTGAGTVLLTGSVTPGSMLVSNTTAYTFSGDSIDGTGVLTKDGTGMLTLSGANGYSGGTVINAGTLRITSDASLGAADTAITFGGSATLRNENGTIDLGSRPIAIDSGAIATFYVGRGDDTITDGAVTGDGGVALQVSGGASPKVYLSSTNNTFTGPVEVRNGSDNPSIYFNSLADSSSPITLYVKAAHFYYDSGAVTPLVLNNRPIVINGGGYINNNSSYPITINSSVTNISTSDNRVFALAGSQGGTINANIDEGATTLGLNIGGPWTLTGTNTIGGEVYLGSGSLTLRGISSMPAASSKFKQRKNTPIYFQTDDSGTVNLGNEIEVSPNDTSTGVISHHSIDVRNNGGTTTNTTIVLGLVDLASGDLRACRQIDVKGANGYRLQVGDVDLHPDIKGTQSTGPNRFYPTTAAITIAGTVKQLNNGSGSYPNANKLYLGGTASSNMVTGLIADADDYVDESNPNAVPLRVYKGDTGDWTFASTNSYSGGTEINKGTLYANTTNALGLGDVTISGTTADLIINDENAMAASATLGVPNDSAETLILNTDLAVAGLKIGGIPQPNGIYPNTLSWIGGSGTLTVGPASAGPAYWDLNGAANGAGSATPAGTWNAANTLWNDLADGTGSTVAWAAGRSATFAAGADATGDYTVTVDGTQDIGGLTFEEGNVTLSGGTALRMLSDTVAYVASENQTGTVATAISEDGTPRTLAKSGEGTLVLDAANSYSGPTVVALGTLKATAGNALGAGDVTVNSDATLLLTDPDAIVSSAGLVLSGGTLLHDTGINISNLTITANNTEISGTSTLNFAAGGTINNTAYPVTIRSAITGSPVLSATQGSNQDLTFAPTVGSVTLGAISGNGCDVILGGTTDGNSLASDVGAKLNLDCSGTWTINGDASAYEHHLKNGTLICEGEFKTTHRNFHLKSATLVINGTTAHDRSNGIGFESPWGGMLKGTGIIIQPIPLTVPALCTIAPGYPTGSLTVQGQDCTIAGTLRIEVDAAQSPVNGTLAVDGELDISSATLELNVASAPGGTMTIATYDTLVGSEFAVVTGLPSGWTINYEATAITVTPSANGTVLILR